MADTDPIRLLFVCGDNAFASPIAAAAMAVHADRLGTNLMVASAGLHPAPAMQATMEPLLTELGVRRARRRPRRIEQRLADHAQVVVTMTAAQASECARRVPDAADRMFVLRHLDAVMPPRTGSAAEWLERVSMLEPTSFSDTRWDIRSTGCDELAQARRVMRLIDTAASRVARLATAPRGASASG